MFISFLPPLGIRQAVAPYLWVMYKQMTHLRPDEVAFIGSPDYFGLPSTLDQDSRWDIDLRSQAYAGFEIPSDKHFLSYRRLALPANVCGGLNSDDDERRENTRTLITERMDALEAALQALFEEILAQESIEAILCWCNTPSLVAVARACAIPVIHSELGPLRGPNYLWTAYFDFSGVNGETEAHQRFQSLSDDSSLRSLPMLDRRQLLSLMLAEPNALEWTAPTEDMPTGLPLQVEDDTNIVAFSNGWDNLRLIEAAGTRYSPENLLIRHHPGGLRAYPESYGPIDRSASSLEFVLRCRRIVTINSSVGLEAMLLGRETIILGDNPAAFAARRTIGESDSAIPLSTENQLQALNFIVFGYLIPYELAYQPDYIRWRLGQPDEAEIYKFHFDYWQALRGMTDLGLRHRETPHPLIAAGLLAAKQLQSLRLRAALRDAQRQLRELERFNEELTKVANSMANSNSWRITAPLRKLDALIRRRHDNG